MDHIIIGHRGAISMAPENTLASCFALSSINCNWIEIDVILSNDNIPIIFHDKNLDRCTNFKGEVKNYTINQLNKVDTGYKFSRKFKNEKIPTLSEFIFLSNQLSINIFLELKSYYDNDYILVNEVINRLKNNNHENIEIILCSYSRKIIEYLNINFPNYKKSLIVDKIPNDWLEFTRDNKCYSINILYNNKLNINNINDIKECCVKMLTYCHVINNNEDFDKLKEININGIITDNPQHFLNK